jgi:hypothetical protein
VRWLSASLAAAGLWVAAGCGEAHPPPIPPSGSEPDAATAPATAPAPGPPTAGPAFRERGPETGLDALMRCGGMPTREILEVNGGGIGLLDIDGDEDLDVFLAIGATLDDPTGGPGSRLFRNDGGLRFTDVTADAGIELRGWAFGVAVGDADGDGHDDLYVCRHGPDALLLANGDGTFRDATAEAGLGDSGWSTSAAFGDLDDDGDLDLFVVRYLEFDPASPPPRAEFLGITVMGGPRGLMPQTDRVYENLGGGRFADRTTEWGIDRAAAGYGLNLLILDIDGDGRREVLVGNDSNPNHLWTRADAEGAEGRVRFEDIGLASGLATNGDGSPQATMGYAVADLNADGRPDVFSSNFSSDTNTLHLSAGGGFHIDATRRHGLGLVSRPLLGWGCWFADWDHDGDEDLLVVNGHVYPEATPSLMDSAWRQPVLLMERRGDRFHRVEPPAGDPTHWLATPRLDRATAFGDLDGDGDVDAVVAELNAPVRILESLAADSSPGTGLMITLRDERPGSPNHRGLGAEVLVRGGGLEQRRWLFTGGGFQSSSEPAVHVARPGGTPLEIEVRWPDGLVQTRTVAGPATRVVIRRTG